MTKDYGKLSAGQLQQFVRFLPELLALLRKMDSHIASAPIAKFDELMAGDYGGYCFAYELPFLTHLSLVIVALDRQDEVHEWALSPDPQQTNQTLALMRALRLPPQSRYRADARIMEDGGDEVPDVDDHPNPWEGRKPWEDTRFPPGRDPH